LAFIAPVTEFTGVLGAIRYRPGLRSNGIAKGGFLEAFMDEFEVGKDYSREFIHTVCGGSKQAFLPTRQGKVVAACLRMDLNPQAPDVILCNSAASSRAAGRTLSRQAYPIPVFIRSETDRFRYVGQYAPDQSLTAPLETAPYARNTSFTVGQLSRVIKMKRC
jgi:hypothetical protein